MGKKKQPSSENKKELAVKVDSSEPNISGREPDKTRREPNEPRFDVAVAQDGSYDVVSEKDYESMDYPEEMVKILAELYDGLYDALGIEDGEEIPQEILNEYTEKILAGVDIEKLVEEIKAGKIFGLNEEEKPVELVEEDGIKYLPDITLAEPEGTIGKYVFDISVDSDEEMKKDNVHVRLITPYIDAISFEDAEKDPKKLEGRPTIGMSEGVYYIFAKETMNSIVEIMEKYGHEAEVQTTNDPEAFFNSVREKLKQFAARPDGYYEDTMEYWYNGEIYHEKDVIWLEVPATRNIMGHMKGFLANQDPDGFLQPINIGAVGNIKIENGRKILTDEDVMKIEYQHQRKEFFEQPTPGEWTWWLAKEFAKTKDSIGYAIVCLNGNFYTPVELELDYLNVVFNVANCMPTHHACAAMIIGDLGNMQMETFVKYKKGGIFIWKHRIDQELKMIHRYNKDYDPYDDPYDSPNYGLSSDYGDGD